MPPDDKKKKTKMYRGGTVARFFFAPAQNLDYEEALELQK